MKIIKEKNREQVTTYELVYAFDGVAYAFECDGDGTVNVGKLSPNLRRSYNRCLESGTIAIIEDYTQTRYTRAVGECECGKEVVLQNFTNTCECGIDYNLSGQVLAPRHFWGEETGEHWTDCY